MNRILISFASLLLAASAGYGQDMPLSMFLTDGVGWTKTSAVPEVGRPVPAAPEVVARPTALALTPDGSTWYVASAEGRYVWAFRNVDGKPEKGDRYARLWARRDQKDQPVSALAFDSRGCLFAATNDGLQIFDPTGRLCGVVPFPVKGTASFMGWTGEKNDELVVRIGDGFYSRKMKSPGTK